MTRTLSTSNSPAENARTVQHASGQRPGFHLKSFGCVHGLAPALWEISRRSRKTSGIALTSMAMTCLFLTAMFFAPCLTPEAGAQIKSSSGVVVDDEGSPVYNPSPRLWTRLPAKVDLRNEMPPVADQGDVFTMSCVTFATVYYQMTQYVKHFKHPSWNLNNPEHQFSVAFASSQGGQGYQVKVYEVLQQFGCVDSAEIQYNQETLALIKPTAAQFEAAKPYRISGHAALWDHGSVQPPYDPPNSIQNAKTWLAAGYVLSSNIDLGAPGFPDSSSDCGPPTKFYDIVDYNYKYSIGHGVAICGYDDNINPSGESPEHRGGFLMVNSMGPRWNGKMHGYIWLSYAYAKRCISDAHIMMMDGDSDAPVITDCTLLESGDHRMIATISGTNFGSYRRLAGVTFGGVRAHQILTFTNESINATVSLVCPKSGPSGPVIVYNWEGAASNAFPVDFP